MKTTLFDLIAQGGWAMWPLGSLSMVMFFLIFFCWQQTGQRRFLPSELIQSGMLKDHLQRNQLKVRASSGKTPVERLLEVILAEQEIQPINPDKAEERYLEAADGEESGVSQWIQYLNVIATVAPMVGLLGTVSGMISAFQTIAAGGMGKPELLAGDIGEALITTATGLVIGIPAMIAYFFFRNRLQARMLCMHQGFIPLLRVNLHGSEASLSAPDRDIS